MAILRIKDENGNVYSIPSIKGDPGKSAYQYAQDGGFTGTEEEFTAKLAQDTYSKTEIDAKLTTYVDAMAELLGGDA